MKQQQENFISGPSRIPIMSTPEKEKAAWKLPSRTDAYHASSDASLFSTSLPVFSHAKYNFNEFDQSGQLIDDDFPSLSKLRLRDESKDPLEDSFLPGNEEALLAGLMDDFDLTGLPTQLEDLDDDLFGSGGGLEIESESQDNLVNGISRVDLSDNISGNNILPYCFANGVGAVSSEHPYGEHPSRTLFVRNINSNVEDSELRSLFEQFGDIRTLYAACKHRGFVMISYYDIRAARTAMRALQNKPLRRRKLDIHFSIPKDNPSDKDINQGTLVVFNLDASVSNDDLRQIFGTYGEVKEIRETPHKRHHKFIEFYDVRAAEAALKALNRSDIAGKRIKLEPSRPGGARRSLMLQLSQEQELDETRGFRLQVGSPIGNSPPGNWPNFGSPVEQNSLHGYNHSPNLGGLSPVGNNHLHGYNHSPNLGGLSPVGNNHLNGYNHSPNLGGLSPVGSNHLPGLASILPSHLTSPMKIAPIGKDPSRISHMNQIFTNSTPGGAYQQNFSVPDPKISSNSGPTSSYSDSKQSSVGTLSGPQFLWGSPTIHLLKGRPLPSRGEGIGFPYASQHGSFLGSHHHIIGSAPSGIQMDRHFGFFPESPDSSSYVNKAAFGVMNFGHSNGNRAVSIGAPGGMNLGAAFAGNFTESGSPSARMMSLSRNGPIYFGNGSFGGMGGTGNDGTIDRGRRRGDSGGQMDNKRQYQLDLEKIRNGEDTRTTLMIKNIPNKYTSKMLLAAIDETHKGTYDFLYLPIDFKNKCNVGYAFINMVSPSHIVSFYEAFNGKRWEKFNSEKVASLAYARIQGKIALVSHFQNSSLMNEDKRCRPILFQSEGQETGDLAGFPSGNLNIFICQADGTYVGDCLDSPKADSDEYL